MQEEPIPYHLQLSFYGLSFIISCFFIYFSFRGKLYHKIISEYMLYILISESFFCLTKFLSLLRLNESSPSSFTGEYEVIKLLQISIDNLCNVITIFSTFFIALKVYDSIKLKSSIYHHSSFLCLSRGIIFSFAIINGVLIGCLHKFITSFNVKERCNVIICGIDDTYGLTINFLFLIVIIVVFIVFILSYAYLRKQTKEMDPNEKLIQERVDSLTMRLIYFPLGSSLLWGVFIITQFIAYFANHDQVDVKNIPLTVFYFIITSTRGILYSVLCVVMNSDLQRIIKQKLKCCKKNSVSSSRSNSSDEENTKEALPPSSP